jgi:hypothetical protein
MLITVSGLPFLNRISPVPVAMLYHLCTLLELITHVIVIPFFSFSPVADSLRNCQENKSVSGRGMRFFLNMDPDRGSGRNPSVIIQNGCLSTAVRVFLDD